MQCSELSSSADLSFSSGLLGWTWEDDKQAGAGAIILWSVKQKTRGRISEGPSIIWGTCQRYFSRVVVLYFILQKMSRTIRSPVSLPHPGQDPSHLMQLKWFSHRLSCFLSSCFTVPSYFRKICSLKLPIYEVHPFLKPSVAPLHMG